MTGGKPFCAGAVATGLMVWSIGANAQTEPAPGPADNGLEDVIVTASKRSENVQDVPLAITVLSESALARSTVREFTDLTRVAPSLTISKTTQPANNSIILRGVGTYAYSIGAEPSVSVVVDDVPLAFQAQAFTDLVDVQRIEVLRGPQSTLYGKNASAGLISVVTQPPSKEFTAKGELMVTDDDEERISANISGPITDTLGFRITGSGSDYAGNVHNLTTDRMLNGRNDRSVRGKLTWNPIDPLDVDFTAHYNTVDTDCCVGALVYLTPGLRFYNLPGSQFTEENALAGITPSPTNTSVRNDVAPRGDSKDYGGSVRASYELGDFTLMSITGYQHYDMRDDQDSDSTATNLLGALNPALEGGPRAYGEFSVKAVTQELRFVSPEDRRFRYVVGFFHGDNDLDRYFFRGPVTTTGEYYTTVNSKSNALFSNSTFTVVPKLDLIGGLRFNREDISYTYLNIYSPAYFADSDDDSAVTGRAGLQYHLNDDVMLFGTYSTGYKGQAYDLTSSFNAAVAAKQPVRAEKSKNREIGVKSTLFDRRLILNVTAFDTTFTDFQAQSRDPSINGVFILSNVGSVRTRGVEMDASTALGGLTLNGGIAFVDAVIKDFPDAQCYAQQTAAQGCINNAQDLSGATLNNAPKWKLNAGGEYRFGLSRLPYDFFVGGTYTYQTQVNFSISQDPDSIQTGYGLLNLNTGLEESANGRYRLSLFVNNVFDKHYALNQGDSSNYWVRQQTGNAVTRTPGRDFNRYFGLRLGVSF